MNSGQGQLHGTTGIRVLVAAEIRLYLDGLTEVLSHEDEIEVVGRAEQLPELLDKIDQERPDVVLIDMAMAGSITAVASLKSRNAHTKVVALGVPDEAREVVMLAEVGVSGYVARDATVADLIRTVRNAVRGELAVSPRIAATLFQRVNALATTGSQTDDRVRLTPREWEIVELVDRGLSNKEISRRLCIEVSTVKNHVHNLLEKTHVKRRGQLAARLRHRLPHATPQSKELVL